MKTHLNEILIRSQINFVSQDERFNCEIDSLTGYRTKALLCMPIKDSSGDVIGVAQVINKMNGECFSEIDEKVSGLWAEG